MALGLARVLLLQVVELMVGRSQAGDPVVAWPLVAQANPVGPTVVSLAVLLEVPGALLFALVLLGQVPPLLRQAIIAVEDERFLQHGGVDLNGVLRAVVENMRAATAGKPLPDLNQFVDRSIVNEVLKEMGGKPGGK